MRHPESESQRALIKWWSYACRVFKVPEHLLASFPNGGYRRPFEGKLLKEEGSRPGAPDLILLVPIKPYHGLAVEMKSESGRVSPEQKQFLADMEEQGYKTMVAYGTERAIEAITNYLRGRANV